MTLRIVLVILTAVMLSACRGEDRRDEPAISDTVVSADTTGTIAGGDTTGAAAGIDTADTANGRSTAGREPGEQARPSTKREEPDPPVETVLPLAGRYSLEAIEGEPLPVTIGFDGQCELLLGAGDLQIRDDNGFRIRTTAWERCDGERRNEQTREAEGRVTRAENVLVFDATYESIFGTAHGRLMGERIVIEQLVLESGEQDVEWSFRR